MFNREMNHDEFGLNLMSLLIQNSLGYILPEQRGMGLSWDHQAKSAKVTTYFDQDPSEDNIDAINEIVTQAEALIGFSEDEKKFYVDIEVENRISRDSFDNLAEDVWVYFRHENQPTNYDYSEILDAIAKVDLHPKDQLRIATQQALVGRILPATRSISVTYDDTLDKFHLRAITQDNDIQPQLQLLKAALSEMAGPIPFKDTQVECLHSSASIYSLDHLELTTYLRYESELGYYD